MAARCPLKELRPQRLALIKPSALGDIVHTLPVLTALRRRFPQTHLSWIVHRAYAPLLEGHPDLDAVVPFDRSALQKGWLSACRAGLRFAAHLAQQQFDVVLDLQGLLRSGLMAWATGAPRRIGLADSREGAHLFYTDRIAEPGRTALHAVDRYWLAAEALGASGPKTFRLPIAPSAADWATSVLGNWPRPYVMVSVGSRWLTKRWPPAHFAEVIRRVQAHFGGTAVFLGGADEANLAQITRQRLGGPVVDLTGRTTLPQLAAVLARCDVMLANDTGPLHLAVALGRPVVAPYTCTRAFRTGPYEQSARVVETKVWCAGSYRKRCSRLECMAELTPDRLWPVLREVLQAWRQPSKSA
jgi:heptosyltransferase-1